MVIIQISQTCFTSLLSLLIILMLDFVDFGETIDDFLKILFKSTRNYCQFIQFFLKVYEEYSYSEFAYEFLLSQFDRAIDSDIVICPIPNYK